MPVSLSRRVQVAVLSTFCLVDACALTAQVHHHHRARVGADSQAPEAPEPATQPATRPDDAQSVPARAQADVPLPPAFRNVFYQPNALVQGSAALFTVEMAQPASHLTGRFLSKELFFFRGNKPNLWYALAGVDLETPPGSYEVVISATVPRKGIVKAVRKLAVAAGDFRSGALDVPENFVNPDEAGKRQIVSDTASKAHAYAHSLPTPQWSGDFKKPVAAPATPSFGMTRVLNEELSSQHRGTDFPIKEGAAVSASNAGTVVLAKEMFYEGNCVILDHGMHFFTIYMHLSKMDVKVGDKLKKGALLGLSGATGRVTGPHLHMGVRASGAYIDPTKLLALTLPETGAEAADRSPARKPSHVTHSARRAR